MRIRPQTTILASTALFAACLVAVKLCFLGWEDGASLADGMIRLRVDDLANAKRLAGISEKIATPSTAEIHVTSGITEESSDQSGYVVRLCLNGRNIVSRARVSLNPVGVVYSAPNEDAFVCKKIREIADRLGVSSGVTIVYINTPISVHTQR